MAIHSMQWGAWMELPIVQFPSYVEEMSDEFTHLFDQKRQFTHFKERIPPGL